MTDVIIIGGGAAGLTAGIYAQRAGFKAVLIEKLMTGGQASTTSRIDNYPGFEQGVDGMELMSKMEEQAVRFGLEIVYDEVVETELNGDIKRIKTLSDTFEAENVILAMGAKHKTLGAVGEDRLQGRGVSYCATCDGAFFKGKDVAVIGGGNTAAGDVLELSRYANKVYLVHRRDEMRADKILIDEIEKNDKIIKVFDSVADEICGEKEVEYLTVRNVKTDAVSRLDVSGAFIAVGHVPNSELVRGKVDMDEKGFIITDEMMRTSVKGVFAAGDVRSKFLRQVVTAAADGAIAASAL